MGLHALQPQQAAGHRQAACIAQCRPQVRRAFALWHTDRWLSQLQHTQLSEVITENQLRSVHDAYPWLGCTSPSRQLSLTACCFDLIAPMMAHLQAQRWSHRWERHRQPASPCAGGDDGSSSAAVGLQEAAAKAEAGLQRAGQSAQQALQDAERQVQADVCTSSYIHSC
jgi:hypothetical protein